MTRCCCCNEALSDYEATIKSASTLEFYNMCSECLGVMAEDVPVLFIDNKSLLLSDEHDDSWPDGVDSLDSDSV